MLGIPASSSDQSGKTTEQIAAHLLRLDDEKKMVLEKIFCFESEKKQHILVLDTLESVEPTRRCYHLVGDALIPRTVEEIRPSLVENCTKITKTIETLSKTLENLTCQYTKLAKTLQPALEQGVVKIPSERTVDNVSPNQTKDFVGNVTGKGGGVLV